MCAAVRDIAAYETETIALYYGRHKRLYYFIRLLDNGWRADDNGWRDDDH